MSNNIWVIGNAKEPNSVCIELGLNEQWYSANFCDIRYIPKRDLHNELGLLVCVQKQMVLGKAFAVGYMCCIEFVGICDLALDDFDHVVVLMNKELLDLETKI